MTSFWEQRTFLHADVAVIGGGIIGTSIAINLTERDPSLRVALLERGLLPTGASTRNAGFACYGSAGEFHHDVRTMGEDAAVDLVGQRIRGLGMLRKRCGDAAIGYEDAGGHELFLQHHPALDALDELNASLRHVVGDSAYRRADGIIAEQGFGAAVIAAVAIAGEGMLHSGMLMQRLWQIAAERGVHIHTGAQVTAMDDGRMEVRTAMGTRTLVADRVVVATNAAIPQLLPELDIQPGRGQIVVTTPIPDLHISGTYHYNDGYYYFRNIGNRILLGGGRNTDFSGETTLDLHTTEPLLEHLAEQLRTLIAPGHTIAVERSWAGTMGFSANKRSVVQFVRPSIVVAFGCNGMGVALGSAIADQAAELVMS